MEIAGGLQVRATQCHKGEANPPLATPPCLMLPIPHFDQCNAPASVWFQTCPCLFLYLLSLCF